MREDEPRRRVEDIARLAAKEAVHETLETLGFTTKEPHEMQADMLHLRKMRKRADGATNSVQRVLYSTVAGGVLLAVWEGVKVLAKGHS